MTELASPAAPRWPFARAHPLTVPAEYALIRRLGPAVEVALYNGTRAWLVTGHAEVRALMQDRLLSADVRRPGFPQANATSLAAKRMQQSFVRMDPPQHDMLRHMVSRDFSPSSIANQRANIEGIVEGLLDRVEAGGGTADLVPSLARRLPAMVICQLLDLPMIDADFLQAQVTSWTRYDNSPEQVVDAASALVDYFEQHVVRRQRHTTGSDLVSRLICTELEKQQLSRSELVHMLYLLFTASFHTTANMVALAVVMLLHHDQWQALCDDPALVDNATEELLRHLSIAHFTALRMTIDEIDVAGVHIPANEGVIASITAANHDPDVFADPGRLDLHRDARRHLGFGYGIHQCLGQALARLEIQVSLRALTRRFPQLRLAVPLPSLQFTSGATLGLSSLPVAW